MENEVEGKRRRKEGQNKDHQQKERKEKMRGVEGWKKKGRSYECPIIISLTIKLHFVDV